LCGTDSDILKVELATVDPDPPIRGAPVTIRVKGHLKEDVSDGTVIHVTVKWGLIQLLKKEFDFCEQAKEVDEHCPVQKGPLSIEKTVELPQNIPPVIICTLVSRFLSPLNFIFRVSITLTFPSICQMEGRLPVFTLLSLFELDSYMAKLFLSNKTAIIGNNSNFIYFFTFFQHNKKDPVIYNYKLLRRDTTLKGVTVARCGSSE
jgi:hypothetical protein